jgi:hypothetical protein
MFYSLQSLYDQLVAAVSRENDRCGRRRLRSQLTFVRVHVAIFVSFTVAFCLYFFV